ncbi:MAG: hypothetical protein H0U85_02215 [Gemmatimonadales bacterium]|nr:hypothetical protein [Gemmatimonadales bacterium]
MNPHHLILTIAVATTACSPGPQSSAPAPAARSADRLYAWTASADTTRRAAFLVEFDLDPGSPTAGKIVRVLPAGPGSRGTHHTEHQLEPDGLLFASDFGTGRTYVFDLNEPANPRLHASFTTAGPYGWPHSYVRLANGHRLVTYQWLATGFNTPPGGVAEVRTDGSIVRWASARSADAADGEITPYSVALVPALDRAVTTSTSMIDEVGVYVQVWRLSDLTLLHTLPIPGGHPHDMAAMDSTPHHLFPSEPRVLADGKTVILPTFNCGMYTLTGLETAAPVIKPVHEFSGKDCGVPVVVGHYWLQTVPAAHAIIALDMSTPSAPREVSRIVFADSVGPHWLAADRSGSRLVMNTGLGRDSRLYLVRLDARSGALSADPRFPVLEMGAIDVPGVGRMRGVPHGTVFSR